MTLTGNWSCPTTIKFGAGRISELPGACAQAGITRPLLVTDRGLANLPITTATLDILDQAGLGRGPFAEADDRALMQRHETQLVVSKNAGGTGARAKLDAARALGLPVLMIDRPVLPKRTEFSQVAQVLDWLLHP